jgi:hypothetical protein
MDKTIDALTDIIRVNYPHLLEGRTIVDYVFWNCSTNTEIPFKDLDVVKNYITMHSIRDFTLVIYFNDNTIGYRLKV